MAAVKEAPRTGIGTEQAKVAVLAAFSPSHIVALEQGCIRIPSDTFAEGPLADYFASYMERIGLDVAMIEVVNPFDSTKRSREPVGRLRGTGGGKSLMLDAHMDHNPVTDASQWERDPYSGHFDGTFIYGRGGQDDKGGCVAAISAAEALIKAGIRLKGDLLVCPVAAHKSGGFGTLALLAKGIKTDYAINGENSVNGLATVTVGALKGHIHAFAQPTHPHAPADQRARYLNRNEQIAGVIKEIGPGGRKVEQGRWLTYEDNADLPDFPVMNLDQLYSSGLEGRTTLEFHVRTVPGITRGSLSADLDRVIAKLKAENPNYNLSYDIPPKTGKYGPGWDWPPVKISNDDPLPQAVIAAHRRVTGKDPVVGAEPRLGNVGDASFLQRAGVKSVLYGPGDKNMWVDEKVSVEDLLTAAKVYALAAIDICGVA